MNNAEFVSDMERADLFRRVVYDGDHLIEYGQFDNLYIANRRSLLRFIPESHFDLAMTRSTYFNFFITSRRFPQETEAYATYKREQLAQERRSRLYVVK